MHHYTYVLCTAQPAPSPIHMHCTSAWTLHNSVPTAHQPKHSNCTAHLPEHCTDGTCIVHCTLFSAHRISARARYSCITPPGHFALHTHVRLGIVHPGPHCTTARAQYSCTSLNPVPNMQAAFVHMLLYYPLVKAP